MKSFLKIKYSLSDNVFNKNIKLLSGLMFLLFQTIFLPAQNRYETYTRFNRPDVYGSCTVTKEGEIYGLNKWQNSDPLPNLSAIITKIEADTFISGDTATYDFINFGEDIISIGTKFYTCGAKSSSFSSDSMDVFFSIFNEHGYLLNTKTLGLQREQDNFRSIIELDGYIYCGGYTRSAITHANNDGDAYIVKFDTLGNVIWQQHYGNLYVPDALYSIAPAGDGNIIGCGYSYKDSTWADNGRLYYDAYLLKIDTAGNLLWDKTFVIDPNAGEEFYSCAAFNNGDIIAVGNADGAGYFDYADAYPHSMLAKFDKEGNEKWRKGYYSIWDPEKYKAEGWENSALVSVKVIDDTSFACVGSFTKDTTFYDLDFYDGMLCKYDSAGNLIWRNNYGYNNKFDVLWDMEIMPDGGFVCVGQTERPGTVGAPGWQEADGWVIRTDACGYLIGECNPIDSTDTTDTTQTPVLYIEVFPNPFNETLHINLPDAVLEQNAQMQLFDIEGRKVMQTNLIENRNSINTTSLQSGLYILRIYNTQKEELYKEKLMKM